jgi:retron-type reverse transcriptase/5S rRNA maturation endonuclease (ribonuclease M5)
MSSLEKLKKTSSIQNFAPLLGSNFKPETLAYILYKAPPNEKYKQFSIPKKNGEVRIINAPNKKLKSVQRSLANILNDCIQEIETKKLPIKHHVSHGFKKKLRINSDKKPEYIRLGIHTNARCHRNRRYVLNLDLSDFFPSFNFGRVRGFFIKNNEFKLHPDVATLIAQIACHENELPQGSPCSPIITNLITHILDVRLIQWAKKHKCTYSRYADDITFSTNQKILPDKLAVESGKPNQWLVGHEIEKIINNSGFKVNPVKTRLQFRPSRQVVTGLIVNKKVNIKSEYYRYARSMCHSLFSKGTFTLPNQTEPATLSQLQGILSHIYFIKDFARTPEEKAKRKLLLEIAKKDKKRPKLDSATELYSKFLYFRYFVALECPLILCEGKTDSIYLKAAIKQLAKKNVYDFPYKVKFFPFSCQVRDVMRIHDGTSALKNFIESYAESIAFTTQTKKHPVIVLLDNDKAADNVMKSLKKYNKTEYSRKKDFTCDATENLYVVLLPMHEGKDNKIEDFFDKETLEKEFDGRTFSAKNKNFDSKKHYPKQIFATKIILQKQGEINFSKFQGILELLSKTIKDYPQTIPCQK